MTEGRYFRITMSKEQQHKHGDMIRDQTHTKLVRFKDIIKKECLDTIVDFIRFYLITH